MELFFFLINKALDKLYNFWLKFEEATFVTKRQYRLRFLNCYTASNKKIIAIIQVAIKRVKIKLSIQYLGSNKNLLQDVHPVSACKIAFIANIADELSLSQIPDYIKDVQISGPIIKQKPTLKIIERHFAFGQTSTMFVIAPIAISSENCITLSAKDLTKNHALLYGLGSTAAAAIGSAASSDYLNEIKNKLSIPDITSITQQPKFMYYHILCVMYVGLLISGISIVRRLFPFHVPFTELSVPDLRRIL